MTDVKLTEVVDNMETAVIFYWHVEEGDTIEEGDKLVEVTVDNETYNIVSPVSGILNEVFFEEGDEVEIGETIATIEEKNKKDFKFAEEDE